ncbi:MAG TPA: diaminopimelate decarboxylase [Polyangiaceae bacterium]|nr:diaminopimelate decarboxylase [Polyangiaceae bacterium]
MPVTRAPSGTLLLGGVSLADLVARLGTPTYVYDLGAMAGEARSLDAAFDGSPHLVAYALKANTAGAVVRTLVGAGCGADVVSGAELAVALGCGVAPDRILYSGVAKTDVEIDRAIAAGPHGIAAIQIESVEEIARVEARARALNRRARVGVRVNPGLDLQGATHAHIATGHARAKFGVPQEDAVRAVDLAERSPHLELVGIAMHLGSQFRDTQPYVDAVRVELALVRALRDAGRGRSLTYVDTGGGFGVDYDGDRPGMARPTDFVRAARAEQAKHRLEDLALCIEPGRSLVAPHGVLLARVIQRKESSSGRWLMIDAGMNDLLRPALYGARHRIVPLAREVDPRTAVPWQVVGPVCESSDDFGEYLLPADAPDAVAILDAGAYGFTMASEYNGRQLPVEAFVRGGRLDASTPRPKLDAWVADRLRSGA